MSFAYRKRLPEWVKVWYQSTKDFDGTPVRSADVVVHPRFRYQADIVYDVALVRLAEDLKFNRNLKPVCLPEGKLDVGGKSLLLAGWGATGSASFSKILLYARVDGLRDVECQHYTRRVISPFTKRPIGPGPMVCAKGPSTNACKRLDRNINLDGCGEAEPVGRVYNGEAVSRESAPWMAQVIGSLACGGSIITTNVILTAAHCLTRNGKFPDKVYVLFNATERMSGHTLTAERMMLHPRFINRGDFSYDVALVKLPVDLNFNRIMKPVCLPEEPINVAGKSLLIAGWGATESANSSKILLNAQVKGFYDEECQALLRTSINPITKRRMELGPMICARGSSTNTCQGDSGGPLTLKGRRRAVNASRNCFPWSQMFRRVSDDVLSRRFSHAMDKENARSTQKMERA
ncbi:hypothetical protein MTO96_007864 [Rhipicephalus appendiculatus]